MGAAAVLFVALAGGQARADIILLPGESAPHGGVGHTPESILSIQSPKNTEDAFGKVAWNGSRDVITGEIAKRGEHSKTLSFAQAGITNAGQLRIFMDIEDPDNDLILHEMTLTAYSSDGSTILFEGSFTAGPQFFSELGGGQGHGDYVFGLDATQAARLQAAFEADPNLRLGLFARTSDDTGSFTNFKLGQGPEPIPEPMTMLLFGTGLAGVAAKVRRRRKKDAGDESPGKI
ncbi:MAG: PEP-CTERM sorting domain-containing protein [Acidobacteria bacterium]|nr:PEP-CTERM sorting domain-containing protein [Acidobacteriota bacterium]